MPSNFGWSSIILLLILAPAAQGQLIDSSFTLQPDVNPATTRGSRFTRSAEAEIRFQEGLLHYNGGRLAEAEGDFKAVLATDPGDAQAYYYLGLSQLDQNRPADSIDNFNQSLRIDSSPDEVRAARATALIRLQRYDDARADVAAIERNPQFRGLSAYLRGQLLYAEGDTQGAAKAFAEAKRLGGPESAPAGFYEGLTYLRMRDRIRARQTFRESSLLDGGGDPTLTAASRQLDAVLALQQRPNKPWEAQITIAYEYDSNVIQIGSNIPVPAGIADQADSRLLFQPRGSYSFLQNDRVELGLEGNGYFSWQLDLSEFDIQSYQAGPFINYKVAENLYASLRYGFNYVNLGRDPFLKRHIVTPQLTYVEKDFGYTSAFYQFEHRDFNDDVGDALDRSGQLHTFGILQGIDLPPLFPNSKPASLELSYRYENQSADGDDFDGQFNVIGATLYAPLPIWQLRADVGVNFSFDSYDNPNSLDTGGDEREDFEFNIAAGLTKEIAKDIAIRVDYTFTDHNSNVDLAGQKPYEYDRHQVGVRLIFSF